MRTGEIAHRAGVNIETLRYYERRGLIKEPARASSGYRAYPQETVQIVCFIKQAQKLGFNLGEVSNLLHLQEKKNVKGKKVRATAEQTINEIEKKLASLQAMRAALSILAHMDCSTGDVPYCPIIEALA